MERKQFDSEGRDSDHWRFGYGCDEEPKWYITCDYFVVGDYGGAGVVGEANIRSLSEEESSDYVEDHLFKHYDYGGKELWIADTEENRDLIEGLESNYCLIDEEMHSRVEMEWEEEAWNSWLRSDLIRETAKVSEALSEILDEMADHPRWKDVLWGQYRNAMEMENEYPTFEYNDCCVRVERIYVRFAELMVDTIADAIEALPFQLTNWGVDPVESDILADWIEDNYRGGDKDILIQYLKASAEEMRNMSPSE